MDDITQSDLLRALNEARADDVQDVPPQMLIHINRARALFKVALQTDRPAVRSIEAARVMGLSASKMRDIIRHLRALGEIEMQRVRITSVAGSTQPVPAYKWIERTEIDER